MQLETLETTLDLHTHFEGFASPAETYCFPDLVWHAQLKADTYTKIHIAHYGGKLEHIDITATGNVGMDVEIDFTFRIFIKGWDDGRTVRVWTEGEIIAISELEDRYDWKQIDSKVRAKILEYVLRYEKRK